MSAVRAYRSESVAMIGVRFDPDRTNLADRRTKLSVKDAQDRGTGIFLGLVQLAYLDSCVSPYVEIEMLAIKSSSYFNSGIRNIPRASNFVCASKTTRNIREHEDTTRRSIA